MNEHDGLLLTKSGILPLTGKITGNTVQTITKKTTLPLQKHFACRGRKGKKFVWTDVRKNVRRYVSREVLDVLFLVLRPRAQHDRGFGDTFSTSTTAKSMQIDVIANRTTCPGPPPTHAAPGLVRRNKLLKLTVPHVTLASQLTAPSSAQQSGARSCRFQQVRDAISAKSLFGQRAHAHPTGASSPINDRHRTNDPKTTTPPKTEPQ